MRLNAVVLDMDGLMFDTESIYKRTWQRAAKELGYDLADDFYLTLVGRNNADSEVALVQHFGRDFPIPAFRGRWSELWRDHVVLSGIPRKPGLNELLEFLQRRSIPMAVATSSDAEYAAFSLRAAGLLNRFDCVVTGEQVSKGKPAPDIYIEAARRLGVSLSCCVALEDSDSGVIAAAAAGMRVPVDPGPQRTIATGN